MFTGLVEELGAINFIDPIIVGTRMTISASIVMSDLKIGDSISVNGACLTVVEISKHTFSVDISSETLAVSTFGYLTAGVLINLERAMKLSERLGGHLVAGHVDGIGTVQQRRTDGNALSLSIDASTKILRHCIQKGSITVDGISLTINQVSDHGFSVLIIPHTAKVTTLGLKRPGDLVNIESDLLGKYVERLLRT